SCWTSWRPSTRSSRAWPTTSGTPRSNGRCTTSPGTPGGGSCGGSGRSTPRRLDVAQETLLRQGQDQPSGRDPLPPRLGAGDPVPLSRVEDPHAVGCGNRTMLTPTRISVESPVLGQLARRVRGAGRGNGPSERTAPRPGPTPFLPGSYGFRPRRRAH